MQPREIVVLGHTDASKTRDADLALSKERARAVSNWLKAHGVDDQRDLVARGQAAPALSRPTKTLMALIILPDARRIGGSRSCCAATSNNHQRGCLRLARFLSGEIAGPGLA